MSLLHFCAEKINSRAGFGLTAAAGLGIGFLVWKHLSSRKSMAGGAAAALVEVGEVSSVYIYPVKSLGGVSVPYAECTEIGVKHGALADRQMVVIEEQTSRFVTQRQLPRMALIHCRQLGGDSIQLTAPECEPLTVPLNLSASSGNRRCGVAVWDLTGLPAVDCGDGAARWITAFLSEPPQEATDSKKKYRLVQLDIANNYRNELTRPAYQKALNGVGFKNPVAFSDISSYMIACQTSLDDLNDKLREKRSSEVPQAEMKRFRPNIVVSGTRTPFEESDWDMVKIGDMDSSSGTFQKLKDCHRCILTTVNPEMGQKSSDMEPLKTLKEYRLYDGNDSQWRKIYGEAPLFGINVSIKNPGHTIKVGDKVFASKRSK